MSQCEEMKKNLLEELDGYFMQLVYLKDLINVEKDINDLKKKMQSAPNFTLIVECALVDSYMLTFMRLYDKSEKTKTIQNLIKKCKSNTSLFPSPKKTLSKLEEFETRIAEDELIVYTIKTLTRRRDSILVHNDGKYFGKKLQNDATHFKAYHAWYLINFTEELLEYLFSELSTEESRKTRYDNDLRNLF